MKCFPNGGILLIDTRLEARTLVVPRSASHSRYPPRYEEKDGFGHRWIRTSSCLFVLNRCEQYVETPGSTGAANGRLKPRLSISGYLRGPILSLVNANATGLVQASCKGVDREVAHLAARRLDHIIAQPCIPTDRLRLEPTSPRRCRPFPLLVGGS